MSAPDVPLPSELLQLRRWLAAVFEQARLGLPWPEQVALRAIEGAFTVGVFGAALAAAWRLEALHRRTGSGAVPPRLAEVSRSLETCAFGPLGPLVSRVWQDLEALYPDLAVAVAEAAQQVALQRPVRAGTPRVVR
ncbi:MAG: hypothetical protein VKQ33_06025 [Candidatus Sericytochromatia bacterium]|nr:hypothetical protein [Candidatus Sericytochromatia bacterium]